MTSKRRVVFLTGTRADYGKLKPLALRLVEHPEFDVHIFTTGMHVLHKYGATARAVMREFGNVHLYNLPQVWTSYCLIPSMVSVITSPNSRPT